MALAGYLVLNNVRAAYVEIHTGVLICTPQLHKSAPPPSAALFQLPAPTCSAKFADDYADVASRLSSSSTDSTATSMSSSDVGSDEHWDERRALPLLVRRHMLSKHSSSSAAFRHKPIRDDSDSDSDEYEPVPEDEPSVSARGRARVVQLSGHVVEVIDKELELDTPSYPYTFQVNTYTPAKRDNAGNKIGHSVLADSLLLSAVDERSKALWVKRIRHWNRFGWRETEFVHADDSDFFALQARLLSAAPRRSSVVAASQQQQQHAHAPPSAVTKSASSAASSSSSSSGRPARRRFYRAPTSGLGMLVPPS